MPDTLHPPYVPSATFQPRQLDRWLDINAQNGPLSRTQTFITLPLFSQAVTWKGYSDIVASFNFEGPNNFSFSSLGALPVNPNYLLCVSWYSNGIMYRYSLWRNVGEVIYFNLPAYTGQLIKKNFRLEIWSTNSSPAVQAAPLVLYTSVKGILDYRWGNDTALVVNDTETTNFNNINGASNPPTDIGILYRWNVFSGTGGMPNTWNDLILGQVMALTNCTFIPNTGLPSPINVVNSTSGFGGLGTDITAANVKLNTIAICVRLSAALPSTVFTDATGENTILYSSGTNTVTLKKGAATVAAVTGIVDNTWYSIIASVGKLFVYSLQTGILIGSASAANAIGNATQIQVGGTVGQIAEIILGSNVVTAADPQSIANYFTNAYWQLDSYSIPLIFPSNSISQPN